MTLKQAYEILEYHQKWRRNKVDLIKYTPTEVGKSIDVILKHIKKSL